MCVVNASRGSSSAAAHDGSAAQPQAAVTRIRRLPPSRQRERADDTTWRGGRPEELDADRRAMQLRPPALGQQRGDTAQRSLSNRSACWMYPPSGSRPRAAWEARSTSAMEPEGTPTRCCMR